MPFPGSKRGDTISRTVSVQLYLTPPGSQPSVTVHHYSGFSDLGEPSFVQALGQQSLTVNPPVAPNAC